MTTPAQKTFNALDEHGAWEYADFPTPEENKTPGATEGVRDLTEYEMDLRDWGLCYGIAWALARSEDAFEERDEVANRAMAAAKEAWHRDHMPRHVPIGQPPRWFIALKKAQKAGAV
jgi:hypothetical protein